MTWSSDEESSASPLPRFSCTAENVKILVTLLTCLVHGKRDQRVRCDVDQSGLLFTAHSMGKSLQIKASIGRELFETFTFGASNDSVAKQQELLVNENTLQLGFALNVNLLIECLSMFGPSSLSTTSLRLTYEPEVGYGRMKKLL